MPKFAFFKNEIIPFEDAKISIASPMVNYGLGGFAGIRLYGSGVQLYGFRLYDHAKRLLDTAHLLKASIGYSAQEIVAFILELVRREGLREDCYVRPLVGKISMGGCANIGVKLQFPRDSGVTDALMMFAIPFGAYHKEGGLDVMVSGWRRVSNTMIPQLKITGSYANSAFAQDQAMEAGYDDAIMLNASGNVAEAVAANIFIVNRGELITPPLSADVLPGITRNTVFRLADHLGIVAKERDISLTELFRADEVFFCGTGYKITFVRSVERRTIGGGTIGVVTARIRDAYLNMVDGRVHYPWQPGDWVVPVYG